MKHLLTVVVVLSGFLCVGDVAWAATEVSDNINEDTIWTLAESPYLIMDSISIGAVSTSTLTIEPGVIVKFVDDAGLAVFGNIVAVGTEAEPIYFTSAKNDEIGGDTNEDGDATSPAASDGWSINVYDSPASAFSYVTLSYLDALAGYQSVFEIEHLTMHDTEHGLMFFDGTVSIDTLDISGQGLLIEGSTEVLLSDITIDDGGVSLYEIGTLTAHGVEVREPGSAYAIMLYGVSSTTSTATFTDVALSGGGLYIEDITVVADSVSVAAPSGTGVYISTSDAEMSDVSVLSAGGYGIELVESAVILNDLTIASSTAPSISIDAGVVTMQDADVTNSLGGPALTANDADVTIRNSRFAGGQSVGVSVSGGIIDLDTLEIRDFPNAPGLSFSDVTLDAERLKVVNTGYGINGSGDVTIHNSYIASSTYAHSVSGTAEYNEELDEWVSTPADLRYNYWGDPSGPAHEDNPDGLGDALEGNALFDPWLTEYCETNCHSNILFLPGIMASRLYEGDEKVWEPGIFTADSTFLKLYMDEDGQSVNPHIRTKDVLDTDRAYEQFMLDLVELKSAEVINDYKAVPYDWRLSLSQILSSGVEDEDGYISYLNTSSAYIADTLRTLAGSSKSGKVSIVAHSNGGLLTKALINQLGEDAAELVDQVILVAVPQVGTPQAIGALLHGYDTGIPSVSNFVLSEYRARDMVQNMAMIYQLLPFDDYYDGAGHTIGTPYVTFTPGTKTQPFIDYYGSQTIGADELYAFLLGGDGRDTPAYHSLYNPSIANLSLLDAARTMQESINSSWQAPEGIKVHQIAGVGEYTLAGINYETIQECIRTVDGMCMYEDLLSYSMNRVLDGDGTVVSPSALAMSDSDDNIERWWVNLQARNAPIFGQNREHADILEIDELRDFIFNNLITEATNTLPEYISATMPDITEEDRLIFTLHSPLALSAMDGDGNIVSEYESNIPGARFTRYGEVQLLSMPAGIPFTLILTGVADGSFTLEITEYEEDEVVATTSFSAIPSTAQTVVEMSFDDGELASAGALRVDFDGNTTVDVTYTPVMGGMVMMPDATVDVAPPLSGRSSSTSTRRPDSPGGAQISPELLAQLNPLVLQLVHIVSDMEQQRGLISPDQYNAILSHIESMLSMFNLLLRTGEVT